ncbi:MAG TPA: hypothetical protein VHP30_09495 [Ignavibacteriales bacterium]|nr:hypothetical protein [Ignavibacteriales bacterium]
MKFLALEIEKPGLSKDAFEPYLKDEGRRALELYELGIIRELYFDKEKHAAVLILECDNKKTAETYLASLPLVKAGLITFDIIELAPYTGFSRI